MALSNASLAEYWALLDEVNLMSQQDFIALWRMVEGLPKDEAWEVLSEGLPEIVGAYRGISAETAMLFYEETQGLAFSAEASRVAGQVNQDQLMANARWAFFNPNNVEIVGLLGGIVQKHVIDGSRQYALNGFESAGTGWYRAARPGACSFCRMLATRAATEWGPYGSADAAATVGSGKSSRPEVMKKGDQFHANCMCIPVKASEYEVPDYVETWKAQYYAATEAANTNFDHRAILSEMRKISGHSH